MKKENTKAGLVALIAVLYFATASFFLFGYNCVTDQQAIPNTIKVGDHCYLFPSHIDWFRPSSQPLGLMFVEPLDWLIEILIWSGLFVGIFLLVRMKK